MIWFWIILALAYLLSPYDLIPGMHALGWIDDIIVLVLLYRFLTKMKILRAPQPPPSDHQRSEPPPGNNPRASSDPPLKTPYDILEVPPNAGQDEIKRAYRRLAGQYHPDKVAHLGKEFQEMAEKRFKEIQDAYDQLHHA